MVLPRCSRQVSKVPQKMAAVRGGESCRGFFEDYEGVRVCALVALKECRVRARGNGLSQ